MDTSSLLSCTITQTVCTPKIKIVIWRWQNTSHSWQNEFIYWVTLTFFKRCFVLDEQLFLSKRNSVRNGCLFLCAFFDCIWDLKRHLNTILLANTYFEVHVSVGIQNFLCVRWAKKNCWIHWLWWLVVGAISSFQKIYTTCNTIWCC